MSKKALQQLTKKFKDAIIDTHDRLGNETAIIKRESLVDICNYLREEAKLQFNMLSDLTAVDYGARKPRFEVVYNLYSIVHKHRIRLRVPIEEGAEELQSVSGIWKAANWAEREVWDMYGIRFAGHPDLRRILLYEEFEGHPLRKDYHIQHSQPRMDLRAKERDAVEEYKHYFLTKRQLVER